MNTIRRCAEPFTISVIVLLAIPVFAWDFAKDDTLLKLAIFPPEAKVFDAPNGENIGVLKRGRVIKLLGSDGKWLNFTTRDFPDAWVRWEMTQTLEEWANQPSYDQLQAAIVAWEKTVQLMDADIELSLRRIMAARDQLSRGEVSLDSGVSSIQNERAFIEECFRTLYQCYRPEALDEAAEKIDGKRWAINQGLYYLMKLIYEGDTTAGEAAKKYFGMAEEMINQYSLIMFQVKTRYCIYHNPGADSLAGSGF